MTTLDIILPCYNPLDGWQRTVIGATKSLRAKMHPDETLGLIVVNDGSTSGTWERGIEELRQELPTAKIIDGGENFGKGHAVRTGVAESSATYCIFTDIDYPYTEDSLLALYGRLTSTDKPDIVIGQRPAEYYTNVPLLRRILSKSFRLFLRFLYGLSFKDTQCGLKGFNTKGRLLFAETETNRYLVDLEFLLHASRRRFNIAAVQVELREGIIFTKLGLNAIAKEIMSLLGILYRVLITKGLTSEA